MDTVHVDPLPGPELVSALAAPVGPVALVIFGAVGDLTRRKLIPALCNLVAGRLLDPRFAIVGVGRAELDDAGFRQRIAAALPQFAGGALEPDAVAHVLARLYYAAGDFTDAATYGRVAQALERAESRHQTGGQRLFYLATGPEHFAPVVQQLGRAGLVREEAGRWRRVIVEKPFGRDLKSARQLNRELLEVLREEQIYRIDHYLGKETVQNILVFRFSNGMFEPIWNRRYVDNVQISVAESLGIEGRGGYYDSAGALRDMLPNHLLQLLALVAMEPPTSFEAEAVREEKAKLLRAIQPLTPESVDACAVRGQYGAGEVDGEAASAYRDEPRVVPGSATETFAALRLLVDNWRWADVPFYLRTGKRLKRRVSEIAIQFRRPPLLLFRNTPVESLSRNVLVIRIQPDEGITLRFGAKVPGPSVRVANVAMDFGYKDHFPQSVSTGYETLLYDCIKGDPTLFQRADTVETGWGVVEPVLAAWAARPPRDFPDYAAGSWGPAAADELLARDGRRWRRIEG